MSKVRKIVPDRIRKITGGKDPARIIEEFLIKRGFDPEDRANDIHVLVANALGHGRGGRLAHGDRLACQERLIRRQADGMNQDGVGRDAVAQPS